MRVVNILFWVWILTMSAAVAFAMSKGQSTGVSQGSVKGASSSSRLIWVQKADGAVSCESDQGQSIEIGQRELRASGVEVFASRKGNDGKMHIQMCGAPQGSYNFYEIRESDLAKALKLGFARAAQPE